MITVIAALMFGFMVGYPIGYSQETVCDSPTTAQKVSDK